MQYETTDAFVDWVTVVSPSTTMNSYIRRLLHRETIKSCPRAYHHFFGCEYYPSGWRHYFSPEGANKDHVLVCDGSSLANMRSEHDNPWTSKTVALLSRFSSHFSRIDISVDIHDCGVSAHDLFKLANAGRMDFGRRKVHFRKEAPPDRGITTYIGTRTSPLQLRVYDKGAESKGKLPVTRVEFELKAHRSVGAGQIMAQFEGWKTLPKLFTGLLNEVTDWEKIPAIEALCYGDVITVPIEKRERMMDKKQWLAKQILPTFVKGWDTGGKELWDWFSALVEANSRSA